MERDLLLAQEKAGCGEERAPSTERQAKLGSLAASDCPGPVPSLSEPPIPLLETGRLYPLGSL